MADKLPMMQNLEVINFGDCLIKTAGAKMIAKALTSGHKNLRVGHRPWVSYIQSTHHVHDRCIYICIYILDWSGPGLFQELFLDSNEITIKGGLAIAEAMADKENLEKLMLDCNQFGEWLSAIRNLFLEY